MTRQTLLVRDLIDREEFSEFRSLLQSNGGRWFGETMIETEIAVIGGGIVGLAVAHELLDQHPGVRVAVVEKESGVAAHQSGRNSGVIHSGIYYAPGSIKARLARAGCESIKEFCRRYSVPYRTTGKLIVAFNEREIEGLAKLRERARQNGIECSTLDGSEAREVEPAVRCLEALLVPAAGVVDYRVVCQRLRDVIESRGGRLILDSKVRRIERTGGRIILETSGERVHATRIVNAAGLFSDRIAALDGIRFEARIVPFRGDYYRLSSPSAEQVRGLIYPVPDVRFPFLGVHLTRSIDDEVHAGPNAALSLAREGYDWWSASPRDMVQIFGYSGFWRFLSRHLGTALSELYRSLSSREFARSVRRLVPTIDPEDLVRSPSGVRAQALGRNGELVDDFLIEQRDGALHILNAPSPAATSSLEIAKHVVRELQV